MVSVGRVDAANATGKGTRMNSSTRSASFNDLRALFLNCTLKRAPELSHTQGLIDISSAIMRKHFDFEPARPHQG